MFLQTIFVWKFQGGIVVLDEGHCICNYSLYSKENQKFALASVWLEVKIRFPLPTAFESEALFL